MVEDLFVLPLRIKGRIRFYIDSLPVPWVTTIIQARRIEDNKEKGPLLATEDLALCDISTAVSFEGRRRKE